MTITIQRVENAAIALAILLGFIWVGLDWWWLAVLFLVFDLSAIGYAISTRVGAISYNLVHNYTGPVLLTVVIGLLSASVQESNPTWLVIIAGAWAFHVALDRALGYGLKHDDDFQHTHLGWIGQAGRARRESAGKGLTTS